MTREELIRNLKYTMEKHKNDTVNTFGTDISAMCKDILDYLEQEPTTKNDLRVDCVARQDVERYIEGFINEYTPEEELEFINLELDGLKYLPSVTPQEPFKPMVEIDLYSVIKQKYIEREVLDKIRAEIAEIHLMGYATIDGKREIASRAIMQILDKYKAESEET